jgi:cardiolipin synthase
MHTGWVTAGIFLLDLLIRVSLSLRVIMRRLPVGITLAWLAVILIFPIAGSIIYLFVGEYRLGYRRRRRAAAFRAAIAARQALSASRPPVDEPRVSTQGTELVRLGRSLLGAPVTAHNRMELLHDADSTFTALIADIDRAAHTCELESYIWSPGGRADDVGAAIERAASRGVICRVLVDAFGSAAFLRSDLADRMRRSGVQVHAALRAGPVSALFARPDLRLHRKIAVIDRRIAFTGSLNLADPRFFKQQAGVGQWVDAMARIQGPAVAALSGVFLQDWAVETGTPLESLGAGPEADAPAEDSAAVQVFSSGPASHVEAIEQIVLMALYLARTELVITTPYFIPSESLLIALLSAASRGVQVTLIVPARIDSRLVHYGSRAFHSKLLAAGVRIALFEGGLLHTKSMTIDGQFSLFGSLNLDPRSLRLDFEVTLAIYDAAFTSRLRALQQRYLDRSNMLDPVACASRTRLERLAEDLARLAGPLL